MQTIQKTQSAANNPYAMPDGVDLSTALQVYVSGNDYIVVEAEDALQSPLPAGVTSAPQYTTPDSLFDVAAHKCRAIESVTTTPFTINRNMIGMNIGPEGQTFNHAKAGFIRLMDSVCQWRYLETSAGVYSAARVADLDAQIDRAYVAGCELIYVVHRTPDARSRYPTYSPATQRGGWLPGAAGTPGAIDYTSLTAFITWLLNRYGSKITAIEGWNEPGVNGSYVDTAAIAGLKGYNDAIYDAIAAWNLANGGTVKMVGFTNTNWDGITSQANSNANLAAAGCFTKCDVVGYHIYRGGGTAPFSVPRDLPRVVQARFSTDGISKPLWLTEFGESTIAVTADAAWFKRILLYWFALGVQKIAPYSWDNMGIGDMRVSGVAQQWYDAYDDLNGKTVQWVNVLVDGRIAASIDNVPQLI